MPEKIINLTTKNTFARVALGFAVLAALVFAWFAVRWQMGNMLAELTSPSEAQARQSADAAVSLAPGDPVANWLKASVEKDVYTPEKISKSVELYENVVRLSPDDYRWRVELGRAYEQADKLAEAENSLKKAVALAPEYAFPHWQLGNFYLRRDRADDAFAEFRRAAGQNSIYREQIYSIAYDFFDGDKNRVEQLLNDSPDSRVSLVKFYVNRNLAADALRIWNTLSPEAKSLNPNTTKLIAQVLYEKRFFLSAVAFAAQLGIDPDSKAETVTNGGFEKPLTAPAETYFGWKAVSSAADKIEIKVDPTQKKAGAKSLRIVFSGYTKPELYNIGQLVAVEPGKKYRLSFWVKTENLRSAGAPLIEIVNANDDKLIVSSKPFPAGTENWQEIILNFTAPENCEGITIRTARAFCGDACPIVGTIWYDEYVLTGQ